MTRASRLNRRGVSPIISSLMLVVITVASGAVAYVFIAGYVSQSAPSAPTSTISVDSVNGNTTNVTIYVRNTGADDQTVDFVYVYSGGALANPPEDVDVVVPAGAIATVVIPRGSINSNTYYNFKIICLGNTMTATFNSCVNG